METIGDAAMMDVGDNGRNARTAYRGAGCDISDGAPVRTLPNKAAPRCRRLIFNKTLNLHDVRVADLARLYADRSRFSCALPSRKRRSFTTWIEVSIKNGRGNAF